MLVGVIFITIIIIFLIIMNKEISSDFSEDMFPVKIVSFFIGFLLLADIYCFMEFLNPSIYPMDVYRGKTTLKYTIVDGIKTDSCVVWKSDIKK